VTYTRTLPHQHFLFRSISVIRAAAKPVTYVDGKRMNSCSSSKVAASARTAKAAQD
jgi:hypothetical protein